MSLSVAIVGPPLDFLFGGQEVQAHALLTQWRQDAEVIAAFVSSRPSLPNVLSPFSRVPFFRTVIRLPLYISNLVRAIDQAELIHIFAGSFGTFLVATAPAFVIARALNRKTVIHYHSGRANEHLERSVLALRILRASDVVVVPSEFLARSFRKHGISAMTVANVVDLDKFPYHPRECVNPKLLCTRNLESHYGVDVVVRAFATVQREFPDASLCLVGRGRERPNLEKLVRSLALNQVQFMGAVQPDRMPTLYSQFDIFVNGSYVDCEPVSILEAFSSGLPVVTTASGGIPFLVQHEQTGLLSPPGDWTALAKNIIRLVRHPQTARSMAEKARRQANIHSWQSLRPLWLQAYRAAGSYSSVIAPRA
jgi:L-malate glycosyltransferase